MYSSAKFVNARHSGGGGFFNANPEDSFVKKRDKEKEKESNSDGSNIGSFFNSILGTMHKWKDYRQTHDAHFPLQDYLEGTKAGDAVDKVVDFANDTSHARDDFVTELGAAVKTGASSAVDAFRNGSSTVQTGISAKPVIYSDWSPASRLFGMSQDTAFAEHMANTAHQREVADLKAAGLNPVLGISGSGASSVSGNAAVGSSSAEKVQEFPWMDVLGATAGLVTTLVSKKPALGYMVSNVFKAFD